MNVYDVDGKKTTSFLAYAEAFRGGVRVAVGDVDGDGASEIIVAPGPGGGPHVRIFSLSGSLKGQFFATVTTDRHGLYVSVADIDGDGKDEIVTGTDKGIVGTVSVFRMDGTKLQSFQPFDGATTGVRVTGVDADGDGRDEIATALGAGSPPEVRVLSPIGALKKSYLAYASAFDRGIFLASADLNGDGREEVITGTGIGGGPQVRAFAGDGSVASSFFAFDQAHRLGVSASGSSGGRIVALEGNEGTVRIFDRAGGGIGGFDVAPGVYTLTVAQ